MSLLFIIDNSMSVENYINQYLNTINEIINRQRNVNPQCLLTCVTFSDIYIYICKNSHLRHIKTSEIKGRTTTVFYDSVYNILCENLTDGINDKTVIILTDGDDNGSKKVNDKILAEQILKCKDRGWRFIFLGMTKSSIYLSKLLGCDCSILYSATEKSFNMIPDLIEKQLKDKSAGNEYDISNITNRLSNVKLNY